MSYAVGASISFKVTGGSQSRDFALEGSVVVAYGEKIKIATINGKDFVLTVTKYAKPQK